MCRCALCCEYRKNSRTGVEAAQQLAVLVLRHSSAKSHVFYRKSAAQGERR